MTDEPRDNGFDPEEFLAFVRRIEVVQREIDELMADAREQCDPMRQDIAAIKREAADAGVPKTELAAVLRKRRLDYKSEHVGDKLDLEQRANYERMLASLERLADELPGLGEAARDRARAEAV